MPGLGAPGHLPETQPSTLVAWPARYSVLPPPLLHSSVPSPQAQRLGAGTPRIRAPLAVPSRDAFQGRRRSKWQRDISAASEARRKEAGG